MRKTVWILGAGFSASLGGPLLTDLFSERMRRELDATYQMKLEEKNAALWCAYKLYHWGRGEELDVGFSKLNGPLLWRNAEDYLDRLNLALRHEKHAKVITDALRDPPFDGNSVRGGEYLAKFIKGPTNIMEEILLNATQWMAAECCAFIKNRNMDSERWRPFRRWADSLTYTDTIVTFNYDLVLEKLIEAGPMQERTSHDKAIRARIVLPGKLSDDSIAKVYKLHGSVNTTAQRKIVS